jgi:hypothetical protein
VVDEAVHHRAAGDEREEADNHVGPARSRDVQKEKEHRKEQERRAEIALDDDDQERDRPHRDHRQQVLDRWQAERPDAHRLLGQECPVLGQVPGKEDNKHDLQELRRLPTDRAELEGQPRPVHVPAKDEGEEQQTHPGGRPRVLVEA